MQKSSCPICIASFKNCYGNMHIFYTMSHSLYLPMPHCLCLPIPYYLCSSISYRLCLCLPVSLLPIPSCLYFPIPHYLCLPIPYCRYSKIVHIHNRRHNVTHSNRCLFYIVSSTACFKIFFAAQNGYSNDFKELCASRMRVNPKLKLLYALLHPGVQVVEIWLFKVLHRSASRDGSCCNDDKRVQPCASKPQAEWPCHASGHSPTWF